MISESLTSEFNVSFHLIVRKMTEQTSRQKWYEDVKLPDILTSDKPNFAPEPILIYGGFVGHLSVTALNMRLHDVLIKNEWAFNVKIKSSMALS